MVQEYGRYFNMPTCCLRGGCLTGPNHSGVELHGFFSYLIKCNVEGREYKVSATKASRCATTFTPKTSPGSCLSSARAPRVARFTTSAAARSNACSILEAFEMAEQITGRAMKWRYVDQNRIGDHICYYSDLRKMKAHYPAWGITKRSANHV